MQFTLHPWCPRCQGDATKEEQGHDGCLGRTYTCKTGHTFTLSVLVVEHKTQVLCYPYVEDGYPGVSEAELHRIRTSGAQFV